MSRPDQTQQGSRPVKPSPDFPLVPHASGQWAKKVGGKMFYFGTDAESARERYEQQRKDLEDGKPQPKRRRRSRPRKSAKRPDPDFPLFRHRNGQWAKKVRGKLHYFGVNTDAALEEWLKVKDDLLNGRNPYAKGRGSDLKLGDLCNAFLTSKKEQMNAGELSGRTFNDYHRSCDRLIGFFGKSASVPTLRPEDFGRFRDRLAKKVGPVVLKSAIIRTRVLFNFAFENEYLDKPIRFGTLFKPPARKVLKRAKREGGSRVFTAEEVRRLIDAAKQPLRTMIFIGLNCAFGATDLANLPLSAVDVDAGFIDFPRPKTEAARRCALWPETIEAIREWLKVRPAAKDPADERLLFLTHHGAKWVREWVGKEERIYFHDYVATEFRKLLHKLEIERRGEFYNLRHTFRTVADASKDQPALDSIMGHTRGDMAEEYRDRIGDDRLQAVVELVRKWLYQKPEPEEGGGPATIPFPVSAAG